MFPDLPEGQTNSFQAQVLAVWPDAYCFEIEGHGWCIARPNKFSKSYGNTEADAWQNAFEKLPKE